ncbi:MAG: S1 RNA-binding domain-containing protein [Anaerolineae bacterium]|nr:S1 RNA-binding domain-containing protein [Anaerolineae bacterium]
MITFSPPNAPIEEEYWEALIEGGESGGTAAPALPPEAIWRGLGLSAGETGAPPDPSAGCSWEVAHCAMLSGEWIDLLVVGYNRGGLLVNWNGKQGFVPASHLVGLPPFHDESEREHALQQKIGQTLRLKIIEVDPERSRLVLSEKADRSAEEYRQEQLNQLTPGDIVTGKITNLCSFGAFVDMGGIEGLIHISEISWGRVNHPSDQLTPGQEVNVYVLNIDRERGRVGLSLKRAQSDPWETLDERYAVGQVIQAIITNVVDFGAFAQVEEGVEGLIHISELSNGTFDHPRNVIQEGDVIHARILNLDSDRRRLGLTLRHTVSSERAL